MKVTPSAAFTLSIQGSGNLCLRFRQALLARHPDTTVYDRTQVLQWKKISPFQPPDHAEVADIDVFFRISDQRDEITLRCKGRHRFFSFDPDKPKNDEVRLQRFLQSVVNSVEQLLNEADAGVPGDPPESTATSETPDYSSETD